MTFKPGIPDRTLHKSILQMLMLKKKTQQTILMRYNATMDTKHRAHLDNHECGERCPNKQ